MKHTFFIGIFFSMFALHGVQVIQKQNSNQAAHVVPIDIFIKPALMDTENNCWYYEVIGVNSSDVLTYCSAQNLPLKKPNAASLNKLHKKYDAKEQKYKNEYYAWFYPFNIAVWSIAGLSALTWSYNDKKFNTTEFAAMYATYTACIAGIVGNVMFIEGDRSKEINLAKRQALEMWIKNKQQIAHDYNHNSNSLHNNASYIETVLGENNMVICLEQPIEKVYYTITPEYGSTYYYRIELSLN
jgi:hypothetical protein